MQLLERMVILCLIFKGITILFPIVTSPLYILISNARGLQHLCILLEAWHFLVPFLSLFIAVIGAKEIMAGSEEHILLMQRT